VISDICVLVCMCAHVLKGKLGRHTVHHSCSAFVNRKVKGEGQMVLRCTAGVCMHVFRIACVF